MPAAGRAVAPRAPIVDTSVGIRYCAIRPSDAVIAFQLQRIRADVRAARQAGRLVIYAKHADQPPGRRRREGQRRDRRLGEARLGKAYGGGVWVLDPGAYQLPRVERTGARRRRLHGDVDARAGGRRRRRPHVDMVHFTGPGDMRAFFGCGADDLIGCLARWLAGRAAGEPSCAVSPTTPRRAALPPLLCRTRVGRPTRPARTTSGTSFVRINRKRALGDQIAIFFDGRAVPPAAMETEISPGYEVR